MANKTQVKKIIETLNLFCEVACQKLDRYRVKPTDFTRNRILTFPVVVSQLLSLFKSLYKQSSTSILV